MIAITFAILAAVSLWLIIAGRGWWPIKLGAVVGMAVFALLLWQSESSLTGWPAARRIPEHSAFVQSVVIEPGTDSEGVVYVWAIPPSQDPANPYGYSSSESEPRAYQLPYTRKLHEAVQAANQAVAQGKPVEVGTAPQAQGRKGAGKPGKPRASGVIRGGALNIYILPPHQLPQKGTP